MMLISLLLKGDVMVGVEILLRYHRSTYC